MNIGIVTTWFSRGAAYVSRAYMETLNQEHNVFIYARGGEQYAIGNPFWDKDYVTWGQKSNFPYPNYIVWNDFVKWIKLKAIDLLIFNEQRNWDVIIRCQDLNVVIGAYVDYYTKSTVSIFTIFDFLLCNTRKHFSVFKDHPQAIYIPWGTDCNVFKPHRTKTNRNTITFFHSAGWGGESMRKGTDILVRSFQNISGNSELIIHSQVGYDNYPGEITESIKTDPRIQFIVATVPAPGLYYLGDVYVYPSKLEGIGLTIAEALASGLPVITTNSSPMNEFVFENVNGKLIEVENHITRYDDYYWPLSICSESKLTDAMQFYVDNPDALKIHQIEARRYADDFLDWKKNSKDLSKILVDMRSIKKSKKLIKFVRKSEAIIIADYFYKQSIRNLELQNPKKALSNLAYTLLYKPDWLIKKKLFRIIPNIVIGMNKQNNLLT